MSWVWDEFEAIEKAQFDDFQALELRPAFRAPLRPREGMIIYADGSSYNPGFGEGVYGYRNGLWVPMMGRPVAAANVSLFVNASTGSDSNAGTSGSPFLTIQKGIDTAAAMDLSIFSAQINLADGTYSRADGLPNMTLKSYVGKGPISIVGNATTPANVLINTTSADCISAANLLGQYNFSGMKLQANTFGYCGVRASGGSTYLVMGNIDFGTAGGNTAGSQAGQHVLADANAAVDLSFGTAAISSGAAQHALASRGAIITNRGMVYTLTGTLNFAQFVYTDKGGMIFSNNTTFSTLTTNTGARFYCEDLGLIFTGTGGVNTTYFPGATAGTVGSEGKYR